VGVQPSEQHAYQGNAKYLRGHNDARDNNDNGGLPTEMVVKQEFKPPVHSPKLSGEEALRLAIAQSKLEELAK
jgi:hypothetical protein